MNHMLHLRSIALRAALGAVLAAPAVASAEEIIIGAATAQTGALAPYDQPALAGFRMALEQLNAKGGLGGKYVAKLLIKDTRSDTAQTIIAVQELIDAGAKIMITPCDGDVSVAAAQITQPRNISTLTLCGSAPAMTQATGDVMFGTYPADNIQAAALAKFAIAEGKKTAYLLISPDNAYTANLPEYFAQVFETNGGRIVARGTFTIGQPDFSAEITKIKNLAEQPDIIMTAAYEPNFPAFIRQLRAAGVDIPIYGADGVGTPNIGALGDIVDGVIFTGAGCVSEMQDFNEAFAEYAGHAPESTYEVNGYEIGLILDAALGAAESDDPRAIRDAIAALEKQLAPSVQEEGAMHQSLQG